MRIFLSWSGRGSLSWKAARLLDEYLPLFIDDVDPWMSEEDISAGNAWRDDLLKALDGAEFCVICLDRQSLRSSYIPFEAGFIARSAASVPICPYLIGLSPKSLSRSPLAAYQAKQADREGTWGLIATIARMQPGWSPIYEQRLKKRFEGIWKGEFAEKFKALLSASAPASKKRPRRGAGRGDKPDKPEPTEASAAPEAAAPPDHSAGPGAQTPLIDLPTESKGSAAGKPPKGPFKLWLFNTSYYPRKGYVTYDWNRISEATGIVPEEVVVRDAQLNELPSQVDYFEQSGRKRAALAFSLINDLRPVGEDYSDPSSFVTVERGKPKQWPNQPQVKVDNEGERPTRVRLSNERLEVWLELQPKPWESDGPKKHDWYAGAATTVLLDGTDTLDVFRAMFNMVDLEKRCMQLDRLWLLIAGNRLPADGHFNLINSWYHLISRSSGPVRSTVTIASPLFNYNLPGQSYPEGFRHKCRLYRTISLYKGGHYVAEQLRVYANHEVSHINDELPVTDFETRYFSYMDMSSFIDINVPVRDPQWFTITSKYAPYQGYGFVTSGRLSEIKNPDPDFPREGSEDNSFIWELKNCRETTCLHMFMRDTKPNTRDTPEKLASAVRRAWHELIERPLVALAEP